MIIKVLLKTKIDVAGIVKDFMGLPLAENQEGNMYKVNNTSGYGGASTIRFAGIYYSDGEKWLLMPEYERI
jgi:hypothetical protein